MQPDISHYNDAPSAELKAVCDLLAEQIDGVLSDAASKIWHVGHNRHSLCIN